MNAEQRKNTENLRDIIQAKINSNEPPDMLDSWSNDCGTHGCVLGDYVIKHRKDLIEEQLVLEQNAGDAISIVCEHFYFLNEFGFVAGISNCKFVDGAAGQGTLQERLDYVNAQLLENNK